MEPHFSTQIYGLHTSFLDHKSKQKKTWYLITYSVDLKLS